MNPIEWPTGTVAAMLLEHVRAAHTDAGGGRDGACAGLVAFAAIDAERSGLPIEDLMRVHMYALAGLRLKLDPSNARAIDDAVNATFERVTGRKSASYSDTVRRVCAVAWEELSERLSTLAADRGALS